MTFTVNEIMELLEGKNDDWLFDEANRMKEEVYGREVFLRGIIENSNHCSQNCLYCGIRREHKSVERYRLDTKTTLETAFGVLDRGIASIVLQAGEEQSDSNIAFLDEVIPAIKKNTDADITLSHGNFSDEVYAKWKELGASRYLIKMETMQKDFHEKVRAGANRDERLSRIQSLIKLGYQVGSGFIAGMPGYTNKMLAQDMVDLYSTGIHMFSLSPFINTPGTPWAEEEKCTADLVYRACAVYRIMDQKINIPVTNALNVLDPGNARANGLKRGCNVIMHSFTPASVRKNYEIYTGKGVVNDEALGALNAIKKSVEEIGLFMKEKEPGKSKKEMNYGQSAT